MYICYWSHYGCPGERPEEGDPFLTQELPVGEGEALVPETLQLSGAVETLPVRHLLVEEGRKGETERIDPGDVLRRPGPGQRFPWSSPGSGEGYLYWGSLLTS